MCAPSIPGLIDPRRRLPGPLRVCRALHTVPAVMKNGLSLVLLSLPLVQPDTTARAKCIQLPHTVVAVHFYCQTTCQQPPPKTTPQPLSCAVNHPSWPLLSSLKHSAFSKGRTASGLLSFQCRQLWVAMATPEPCMST